MEPLATLGGADYAAARAAAAAEAEAAEAEAGSSDKKKKKKKKKKAVPQVRVQLVGDWGGMWPRLSVGPASACCPSH